MSSVAAAKAYTGQTNFSVDISANTEVVVQNTEDGKVVYIFSPIFFEGQCTVRDSIFKYTAKLSPKVTQASLDKFPKTLTEDMQKAYSDYIQRMSTSFDNATVEIQTKQGVFPSKPKPVCAQDTNADIICTIESYELV